MASYRVEVTGSARKEVRQLPGNMRQRVIRALRDLEERPRPETSQALDLSKGAIEVATGIELRRIRLDSWRVVYVVAVEDRLVTVLAVRRRPPYHYEDLKELLQGT
jgi:mRNA-degrading endonuclease RelE of RelBE toxin-antitoxin system